MALSELVGGAHHRLHEPPGIRVDDRQRLLEDYRRATRRARAVYEDVFFSWANAITIGLVLMYVLCNIGEVRYYLTEGRAQFNPLLHIVVPVIASAAGAGSAPRRHVPK